VFSPDLCIFVEKMIGFRSDWPGINDNTYLKVYFTVISSKLVFFFIT